MLTLKMRAGMGSGRLLLLVMLGVLHAALLLGVDSPWAHPLLLAHLGLFLIWQPLWRGEREVDSVALIFIVLAAAVTMLWLNWWSVSFWLTGLFGLVGARVFNFRDRWTRLLYLSVMAYLLTVLLLWSVPNLFAVQTTMEVGQILMRYVLPVMLLVMLVLPVSNEPMDSVQTVDFIYSLLLFMLLALVVLGSLAIMTLTNMGYLEALLRALFLISLVLLALGGLWNPRFGFSGLHMMFSRYLLNVGTPFESWLAELAATAQRESDPAAYLRHAIALLARFHWLSGLSWQSPDGAGQLGQLSANVVRLQEGRLHLSLYAKQALNPSVLLHIHLLAQLIGYFYQAKQREQSLRDIAHLQAVYETGSRLTHDLKNMLQSLLSLTALAQNGEHRSQQLLLQQLPQLTKRIELTLNKLQLPQVDAEILQLPIMVWWGALQQRNEHQHIKWITLDALSEKTIPAALFDCVLDNLLDNALKKRQSHMQISITVEIQSKPLRIIVRDNGAAIPEAIAVNLLRSVAASDTGLGIGLYQAARWAEQSGYHLELLSSQEGNVSFEFSKDIAAQGALSRSHPTDSGRAQS